MAFLHIQLGASEEQAAEHYVALAPTPEQLARLAEEYSGLGPGAPMSPAVTALFGVRAEVLLDTFEELRRRHGRSRTTFVRPGWRPRCRRGSVAA